MRKKIKDPPVVVLDTNILISYLLGSKTISLLIDSLDNNSFIPAISPSLEAEFYGVIKRPRIARSLDTDLASAFMADWVNFAVYVTPVSRVTVCRDPGDNAVLECALTAGADFIVTGDDDLLTLHSFHGIPIHTPAFFIRDVLKIG